MRKQSKDSSATVVVGASGSVGILPDGYFAKILSDPGPEPHQADSTQSEGSQAGC